MAITRRQLLAAGMNTTVIAALGGFAARADAFPDIAHIKTFYDPRFDQSVILARALPGTSKLQPITGDPSTILMPRPSGEFGHNDAIRMQGVTTETVPFCLEHLSRSYHRQVRLRTCRLNRDLFAWSLTVRPGVRA